MSFSNAFLKPLFALTLFLSAFLLFSVQPMIGKALLPVMGGSPSVWNTAMVFFQVLLLGGYLYAFLLSKLSSLKVQGLVHAGMTILAAGLSLPLSLKVTTDTMSLDSPYGWQLLTMAGMVAAPFFILAATAPLLQRWFSLSSHAGAQMPYGLYVASNAGSLLALLAYPVVIERFLHLSVQAHDWSLGYGVLAVLVAISFIACGFLARQPHAPAVESTPDETPASWRQRFTWMFLAFVPSSLMIGYTTYVTTDVTSLPLFWVIPLALYLVTFMIAFATKPPITIGTTRGIHAFFVLCFLWFIMVGTLSTRFPILIVHAGLFFFTALLCHHELARTKPSPARLTEFYLFMSLGGALGGLFNSLLAPVIFPLPYEYLIAIVLGVFARHITDPNTTFKDAYIKAKTVLLPEAKSGSLDFLFFPGLIILGCSTAFITSSAFNVLIGVIVVLLLFNLHERRWAFGLTVLAIVLCKPLIPWNAWDTKLLVERNFYGIHFVQDEDGVRMLKHGTTVHGAQARGTNFETIPITYYYMGSGAEDVFSMLDTIPGPQRIAALGLGSGSISCFFKGEREFDFYEIDPSIAKIATNPDYFTYLKKCHSKYRIIMGDARQEIAKALDYSYDMIFVDVFSSDNIPIHVATTEAVALYKKKLKPGGLIVFHTSSRFFNLEPEIASIGKSVDLPYLYKVGKAQKLGDLPLMSYPTKYVVLTENPTILAYLGTKKWGKLQTEVNQEPWSDDYANVLRALRF